MFPTYSQKLGVHTPKFKISTRSPSKQGLWDDLIKSKLLKLLHKSNSNTLKLLAVPRTESVYCCLNVNFPITDVFIHFLGYLGIDGCEARTAAMTPVFCVCSSASGLSSSSDFNLLRIGFGGGASGVLPLPWRGKHSLLILRNRFLTLIYDMLICVTYF